MRVICVVVLLIAAAQGAVLDINRCKLDGENACRDYSTAAKCQTSNYCKAEIWGRATDPSKTCQKCLNDIKTIQTFVDSKSTREFVRNDLNALCDLCLYETGRTECKSLIKAHFDEIYQDIVDKLDPNAICRALRLCQQTIAGSEMRETPSEIKVAAANILMKKLEEEHYAKVAPWMPGPVIFLSLDTKCKDYTTAKAFGVLENCKAFWSAPTKDDDICEECKKEIAKLQNWVKSEKTKDEIKKDILMFCDKIPFQAVKDECHTLIAEGFDMIYDDIIAMLDPGTLCTGMKFCNSINVDDMRKATCNLNGNNACLDYTTAANCKATNYCKAEIWSRPVQNTKFCDMCLEDVGNLQKFIDANSTREFVQKDLLALCKLLPWKQFSYKCQTTVIKNFEEIYDDIVKMLDPKAVCRALFICQSKMEGNALPDLSLTRIDEKIPKSIPENTLCTIDSQNACRDISTAKKCNALSACGPVWSGPTKDNVYCDMCKIEIGKLQDWMKKQTSKALVKKDLEQFCTEIPLSAFGDACTQLVDEDFDTIYDQILTALDPSAVCTAIKLCTLVDIEEHLTGMMDKLPEMLQKALTDNKLPIAAPFKSVNSDSCMDCEAFIKDFQNVALNNKKIVNDWMTMLKTECKTLGAGIGELCEQNVDMVIYNVMMKHKNNADCEGVVDNYFPKILKQVSMLDPMSVCKTIMMCDQFNQKRVGDMCTDCKTFFKDWQDMLKSNSSAVEKIDNMIIQECASLGDGIKEMDQVVDALAKFYCLQKPEELRDQCARYVAMVIRVFIERIKDEDVGKICTEIEFCDPKKEIPAQEPDLKKLAKKISKVVLQSMPKRKHQVGSDMCMDCKNFITDLQGVIMNNKSLVQELVDLVKQECESLGPELGDINKDSLFAFHRCLPELNLNLLIRKLFWCKELVHKNYEEILKIFNSIDPDTICNAIMMCGEFVKPKLTGDLCTDCQAFFSDWQNIITNNQSIINELNNLIADQCSQLGPEFSKLCDTVVKEYLPQLWDLISSTDPEEICSAALFCESVKGKDVSSPPAVKEHKKVSGKSLRKFAKRITKVIMQSMPEREPQVGSDMCMDCKNFITDLQGVIMNNKSLVQELVDLVKQECEQLGPELGDVCKALVESNYDQVLKAFSALDADTICMAIMMCGEKTKPAVGGDLCTDCQAFFSDWQNIIISNQSFINEINNLISEQCSQQLGPDFSKLVELCEKSNSRFDDNLPKLKKTICENVSFLLRKECDHVFDEVAKELIEDIKKNCDTLVKEYLPQLWDLLSSTDPEEICSAVDFCESEEVSTIPAIQIQPALKIEEKIKGDDYCMDCTNFIGDLQNALINDTTLVQKLVDLAKQQCDQLGSELAIVCKGLVEDKYEDIIKAFESYDVDTICKAIMMCSQQTKQSLRGDMCMDCQKFAADWQNIIANNKTIIDTLLPTVKQAICNEVPSFLKGECDKVFDEVSKEIIDAIQNNDPEVICDTLYLCDSVQAQPAIEKKIEVAGDVECQTCKFLVEEVEKMVQEDKTEAAIESALMEICNLYGEDIKQDCMEFMQVHGASIIDFILAEMNSLEICAKLGLCKEAIRFRLPEKEPEKENVKDNTECEVCTLAMTELFNVLEENSTVEQIETELEKICSDLPESYQSECKMIIEQYTPELIEYISQKLTPKEICEAIKLCTSSMKKENVKDNTECEVCTLALTELFNVLEENATVEEIEKELEKICADLPESYQSECKMIIEQYTPELIEYISQKLTPEQICEAIKLCTSSVIKESVKDNTECEVCTLALTELFNKLEDNATAEEIEKELEKLCSDLPDSYQSECKMIIEQYTPQIIEYISQKLTPKEICEAIKLCTSSVKKESVKDNTGCEICTLALTELFNKLEDNATEEEIEKELEKICSDLPESYQSECKMIIEQYTPELIELITQKLTPKEICEAIKLCTSSVKKVESGITCLLCTDVVGYLVKNIPVNQTEESILKELRVACSYLKKYEDKCDEFVNDYGKEIVDLILREVTDPKKICFLIGLCGLPVEEVQKPIEENLKSDTGCELCEVVVKQLDSYLTEDATQAKFIEVFEKVCADLPESDRAQCKNFVETYTPTLLDLLVQELAPNEICALIKLCNSETTVAKIAHQTVKGEVECEVCTLVISEAQKMLEDDATEAEIVNELNKACQILPEKDRDECASFVDAYAKEILDLLAQKLDAKTICTEIKLCAASMKKTERENVKGEVECEFCTLVISEAQKLLEDDATEQEILDAIGKVCPMLKKYEDDCNTFVHEYGPTLLKLLAKELSPSEICTEVKLCVSKTIEESVTSAAECEVCTLIATELDKVLSEESTQAEIEAALKEVCDVLPDSVKDTCNGLVTQYGTEIVNLLVEEFKPDMICVQLELCQSTKEILKVESITSSAECEVCTLIATELDKVLSEESTQEEIEAALKEVCDVLPDSVKDTCNGLVTQYGTEIVNLLVEEFKPDMICVQLDLCQSTKENLKVESITSSAECEVCTLIATELDKVLSEESTQEEIEAALKEVCNVLPDSVKDTCNGLVTQYGTEIVNLLVEEFKPDMICVQLDLCQSTKEILKVESITSSAECEVCTLIATELDKVLSEESTQEEIEAALKEVCNVLPDSVKDTCNGLVTQYGTEIVNLLVEEFKPGMICVQLDLCQSTKEILKVESITSSAECEVCTLIATELDNVLSEESTQEEIEAALKEVCDVLPDSVKDTCNGLVTQCGTEIVNLLVEEFKPDMICVQLNLCKSMEENSKETDVTDNTVCDVCNMIANYIDSQLNVSSTQDEIKKVLNEVCGFIPSEFKDTCTGLVNQNFDQIIKFLLQEFRPDVICVQLELCQSSTSFKKGPTIETCEVCRLIAKELGNMLGNTSTQDEIEDALKSVCKRLGPDFEGTCDNAVSTFYPQFMKVLLKELNPDVLCTDLKLCIKEVQKKLIAKSGDDEASCVFCEFFAKQLDNVLKEDATKEEIKAALSEACAIIPDKYKSQCNIFVEQFGDSVYAILVEEMNPGKICPDLGICPKTFKNEKISPEVTCDVCKFLVVEIEQLLTKNQTEEEVVGAMLEICAILPDAQKEECTNLIKNYGATLYKLLLTILGKDVCPMIGVCNKSMEFMSDKKMRLNEEKLSECTICEVVMNGLKRILNEKPTEQEILNAVNKVCDIVPEKYRSVCHQYINDYAPGVINIIIDDFSPDQVCAKLHACSTINKTPVKLHFRSDEECTICKTVIKEVDNLLDQNITRQEIEKALDKVCTELPSMADECEALINQYAPIIFKYMDNILDPSFICQKMKLCPTEKILLGADPCTYGPSYWCKNLDTAKQCNAVQHCLNHLWE